MCVKIKKPSECNEEEKNNFIQLVKRGGEVERAGLRKRIERAELLAFHYENNNLVGIAAIKQPYKTYVEQVFKKAGVSEKYNTYKLEIGWAFTIPEYRSNSICSDLIKRLISTLQLKNIFATTRTDNLSMQKILVRNGFQKVGHLYLGSNCDYRLQLFILSDKGNCKKNKEETSTLKKF